LDSVENKEDNILQAVDRVKNSGYCGTCVKGLLRIEAITTRTAASQIYYEQQDHSKMGTRYERPVV
jgi:hypothetical protein